MSSLRLRDPGGSALRGLDNPALRSPSSGLVDGVGISDEASRTVIWYRTVADGVSIVDAGDAIVARGDLVGLLDGVTVAVYHGRIIDDSIGVTDSVGVAGEHFRLRLWSSTVDALYFSGYTIDALYLGVDQIWP